MEVAKLSAVIDADTRPLERDLHKASGLLDHFAGGMGSIAGIGFGAAVAGVAGLAGGLVVAGKSAADFQSQISGIAAVGGAEAVSRMSEISAKALQVGKDTSFSATEAAAGMEELIKAGVGINDVLGPATDAMTSLAAATGVGLADAAGIAANAMNQFHLEGQAVTDVADVIAGAANASAIDVNMFGLSLQSVGAVANLVGLSFKDTAVAIAEMGQAGIPASDAGTSLKTMLMSLQPATKKASAEFQKLGLVARNDAAVMSEAALRGLDLSGSMDDVSQRLYSSITGWKQGTKVTEAQGKAWDAAEKDLGLLSNAFFTAEGNAKPLVEIQGELQKAMQGLTKEQQLASLEIMFGSDAIRAAAVLADNGAAGFTKMADAMGKVSAADTAKVRLDNLNGSLDALGGSLNTAAITVGTAFLPSLQAVVKGAVDTLNANMPLIEQFAAELPGAMAAAGDFITGTLVPALSEVWKWLSETLPPALTWIAETAWPALVAAGTNFSTWLTATGIPALTSLTTALGPPLNAVVTWLKDTGFPGLLAATTSVSGGIQGLTTFFGENTAALSILSGVVTAGATAWGLMTAATIAHTIATKAQTIATGLATAAQWALNAALTANPVGIVVVALAGLTAGLVVAYNTSEEFRTTVNNGATALRDFWTWLGQTEQKTRDLADVLRGFTGGDVLAGIQALGRILGGNFGGGGGAGLQRTSFRPGGEGAIGGDAMSLSRAGGGSGWTAPGEIESYIRGSAERFGIDAGTAVKVALSEGGLDDPVRQSDFVNNGVREESFGPFQLYMNGGLGNAALSAGIDPRDPAQWQEAIDFAMQKAAEGGWGPWHGAARVGIGNFEGIGGAKQEAPDSGGMRQYISATEDLTSAQSQLEGSTDLVSAAQVRSADAAAVFGDRLTAAVPPTQALAAAQQQGGVWAQTMAAQQAALTQVMAGQAPAMRPSIDAMTAFGAVLGPIERQVAGGAISMDSLQFRLVDLARATGLATEPWRDYNAGLIDINEAMMRVVTQSGAAGPQFEALRQQLGTTNAITDQGALAWLQLALNFGKATPAIAANATATAGATTATAGLNTATGAVNQTIDPGLYSETAGTVNEMTSALDGGSSAFGQMADAASQASEIIREFLDGAQSLGDYLDGHTFEFKVDIPEIPDYFIPRSPTPFEQGLWGIHDALEDTARISGPSLRSLEMPTANAARSAVMERGGGGGGTTVVQHFAVTVEGHMITEDQAVERFREGLIKIARRNGGPDRLFQ